MIINFLPFRSVWGSGDYPLPYDATVQIPTVLSPVMADREIFDGMILTLDKGTAITPYAYISRDGMSRTFVFVEYMPEEQPAGNAIRVRLHIDPFATMRERKAYWLAFENFDASRISITGVGGIENVWNLPVMKSFKNDDSRVLYYYSTNFTLLALAEGNFYGSDIRQQRWFRTESQPMSAFYDVLSAVGGATRLTDTRGSTTGVAYFENVKVIKIYMVPTLALEHSNDTAGIGTALWWGASDFRALSIESIDPVPQTELTRIIDRGGMVTVGNRVSNVSFELDPYKSAHWDIFVSLTQSAEKPAVLFVCDAMGGMGIDIADSLAIDFQQGAETQEIGLQKMRDAIQTASGVATLVGGVVTTVATGNPAGIIAAGVGVGSLGAGMVESSERTWPRQNIPGGFGAAWPGARMEQTSGFQIYVTPYSDVAIEDLNMNGGTACAALPANFVFSPDIFSHSRYFFIQGRAKNLRLDVSGEETILAQMQWERLSEGVRFVDNGFAH